MRRNLHHDLAAKTTGQRLKALTAIRPGDLTQVPPRNGEPRTGLSMGEHMALTAAEWGITREAQDELVVGGHRQLAPRNAGGAPDGPDSRPVGLHPCQDRRPGDPLAPQAPRPPR